MAKAPLSPSRVAVAKAPSSPSRGGVSLARAGANVPNVRGDVVRGDVVRGDGGVSRHRDDHSAAACPARMFPMFAVTWDANDAACKPARRTRGAGARRTDESVRFMWRYIADLVRCRTAFFVLVGEIMSRSQGSADAEDGSQGRFAEQDMRGVRTAVRMAQEMGARLGRGEILFGAVSGGGRASGLIGVFCRMLAPLPLAGEGGARREAVGG